MDALSSIFTWLSDHEAGISAVVGITVTAPGSRSTYDAEARELMQVTRELVARWLDGQCWCGLRE
jgi:hypothetical protein